MRPNQPLMATILMIVAAGNLLPFSPPAGPLGFAPLPGIYFAYLATATFVYLVLVEFGKRLLLSRMPATSPASSATWLPLKKKWYECQW